MSLMCSLISTIRFTYIVTSYDDGGHLLFDDRVQQIVLYDPQVGLKLPSLSPDRVFGLRKTEAFDKAFDALMSSLGGCPPIDTVIRCTPFQDCNDPLLFPFLILEAKREKDSSNFNDIETQTAIPIWALLQLQEGMQAKIRGLTPSASPLVWFLASRGDYWKVYGSYITEDEPQKYVRLKRKSQKIYNHLLFSNLLHSWRLCGLSARL